MSTPDDTSEVATPEITARRRRALNEDWLATIVGLALLCLVLLGVIPGWLVP